VRELLAAALVLAACDRSPRAADCGDHLGGVWSTDDGAARWHIRDSGRAMLEAYPVVRELPAAPPGTIAAPSMIDLRRTGDQIEGTVVRRWHRGGQTCIVRAPARVRGCTDDRLTLTLGSTGAPADWTACRAPDSPSTTQLLHRVWP
jgi:hypothetical protein